MPVLQFIYCAGFFDAEGTVLPYLIIKKEEVEVALKFVQEVRKGYKKKLTKEETDRRRTCKKQMQALKQREWAM